MSLICINKNNEDIRKELKEEGVYVCECCLFTKSKWIHIFIQDDKLSAHGIGYGCEYECKDADSNKCILCTLTSYSDSDVHIFPDVKSTIDFIDK